MHAQFLFNFSPTKRNLYSVQNVLNIPIFVTNYNFLKNLFFPSTTIEWGKLDSDLKRAESLSVFKTNILTFIRPFPHSAYSCHNPKGLKLVTRLRLGLSHLREHKFKHSFQDTINSLCSCGLDIEPTEHFLLHYSHFVDERCSLLSTIGKINYKLLENIDSVSRKTLLH